MAKTYENKPIYYEMRYYLFISWTANKSPILVALTLLIFFDISLKNSTHLAFKILIYYYFQMIQ